jgi:hypothetical protein
MKKIKEEIDKLIKQIKNLLFYKVINFKFPFSLEKEDLLLTTYQLLVKKNKILFNILLIRFDLHHFFKMVLHYLNFY